MMLALFEQATSPRSVAKAPKPKKGKYIVNKVLDARFDPTISPIIADWNYTITRCNVRIEEADLK